MPSLLTASARSFTTRETPLLVPLYDQRIGPWQIAGNGSFVCGAASTVDISIPLKSVQQQHCRFDYQNGRLTVVRLEGRVWVNEVPLHGDTLLEPDDVISLGSLTLQVLASDPLRPAVSDDDGNERRPVIVGGAASNVIFTGGTDRRFHEAFPRGGAVTAAKEPQRGQLPAGETADATAARVTRLLQREAEAARKEQQLKADELRLAELLAELEQARTDLLQEQQEQKLESQKMAEAVAIRLDAESMQQRLQRERQELDDLSEQLQQQRTQLMQAVAAQQTDFAVKETALASRQLLLEQQQQDSLLEQKNVRQRQAELDTLQAELASQRQLLEQQHQDSLLEQQNVRQRQAELDTLQAELASQRQLLEQQHQDSLLEQQNVRQRQAELDTLQAELAGQRQLLTDRHQSLEAREALLDDRTRRIQQAFMARSAFDSQQLHDLGQQEARAAELASREHELAERVAAVCGWRRRQAASLAAQQADLDAVGHDLRQQKTALRLRARELDAQESAYNQKVAAASVDSSVREDREAELRAELMEAQRQQQLTSLQLTAALTTCEQLRAAADSQQLQSTVVQREIQLQELQLQLDALTASVTERDILIQDLHQQLLTVLAERRDETGSQTEGSPEPADVNQIWRHPDESAELFVPLSVPENAVLSADAATTAGSVTEAAAPEARTDVAEVTLPANESLLQSLPPGVLHQELLRLLQLSQPAPVKLPPSESPSETVASNEDLTSASIVPLLDEGTARMLEQSDPEVRSHVEKILFNQRRTDDETKDMAAPRSSTTSRRIQPRGAGRQESGETAPQPRPPISYIDAYNNGSLSLTSDQPAFEVAAEAADRMGEKAKSQETAAEAPAPVTSRTADEMVRYVRRTNTNATINQSLQQLRRLSAEASQTAITKHSLRRHRKGFLVRTTAIVAGMVAVVWAPPWLLLWTKNPQLAVWGPLAVFSAACLELIRKLVVVLRLERRKLVEPIAKPRPQILRPELSPQEMEADAEIEDQHPLL